MSPISIFAPAKLNLFLAVTGRRADGFHDLVSVAAQLNFGDTLHLTPASSFSLTCSDPDVPCDDSNLVLKAAALWAAETGCGGAASFHLEKRIPMGAGLGGGSSDAVAALRGLNQWLEADRRLTTGRLTELAGQLGSDCALFLQDGPVVMRGRGERITTLPPLVRARLTDRRVLVFKPGFGISTPWAYGRLVSVAPEGYCPPVEAERRLETWMEDTAAPAERLLYNNMEPPAFAKFVALPILLTQIERQFGLRPRMSGSGSACFLLMNDDTDSEPIIGAIRESWGESAFVMEARLV